MSAGHTPGPLGPYLRYPHVLVTDDSKVVASFRQPNAKANAEHCAAVWDLDPEAVSELVEAARECGLEGLKDAWCVVDFYRDVVRAFEEDHGVNAREWLSDLDWDSVDYLSGEERVIKKNTLRAALAKLDEQEAGRG